MSPGLDPLVVPKGYIAVDGTSLTVCEVSRAEGWFNLMLIAHTQRCIVLPTRPVGGKVNLEVDVMGKYAAGATAQLREEVATLTKEVRRLSGDLDRLRARL